MANWYGAARTNYFKVRDRAKFNEWAKTLPDVGVVEPENSPGMVALLSEDEYGDWPNWRSLDDGTDQEFDITDELWPHLARGQVAVFMVAGAEKLRYITGRAIAVDWRGKSTVVDLEQIYRQAARRFKVPVNRITRATY